MESIIRELINVLQPTSLILLLIVVWQFRTTSQKDKKIFEMFDSLGEHTRTIQRLLGVLEGRRIS